MPMIHTAAEARAAIGTTVYWDDSSARYVFLRQGTLEEVKGLNLLINGDWKYLPTLRRANLRTEAEGGDWKRAQEKK